MAITEVVEVQQTALWPQGDIRDPLGVWGFRLAVIGDASGDGVQVTAFVPRERKGAYIYTVYSALVVKVSGAAPVASTIKCRILTNWPNIDPQPGVQAYGSAIFRSFTASTDLQAPIAGPDDALILPQDRFLLILDPSNSLDDMFILELGLGLNVLADVYSFEGYGYFWDRSVLNAPGGLRHPGSS